MDRKFLQEIAAVRLADARKLLDHGHFEGAYYLLGYVIECGLKACIAKQTRRYEFPDKKKVIDSYTHDLEKLLGITGLKTEFDQQIIRDSEFGSCWAVVKDWSEDSRYSSYSEQEAKDLFNAIADPKHGVLTWIRKHW